jgi:hypothetical protein
MQDASAAGMGGIWLPANDTECLLQWRHRFPASTTDSVVPLENADLIWHGFFFCAHPGEYT